MAGEIGGFALSQEELLAALALAGLPALPGHDDLAARVFGALAEDGRMALLAAAERALLAHGCAHVTAQGVELDDEITAVLGLCARPEQTWVLVHQPAGQTQRVTYFHRVGDRWQAHVESAGIHQWLALAGRADVLSTARELVLPLAELHGPAVGGELAEAAFAAVVAAASVSSAAALYAQLSAAGLADDVAGAFAQTLIEQRSTTAFAGSTMTPRRAFAAPSRWFRGSRRSGCSSWRRLACCACGKSRQPSSCRRLRLWRDLTSEILHTLHRQNSRQVGRFLAYCAQQQRRPQRCPRDASDKPDDKEVRKRTSGWIDTAVGSSFRSQV